MFSVAIFAGAFVFSVDGAAFTVIAHRGASGYLPEHTLEAYALAYGMGADYIEPDLIRTKDGEFICMHDLQLNATTDAEEMFPDRKRGDGKWYAADLTLAEIRSLHVHERSPKRFPRAKSDFRVPTFQEMIELVQGLNATTKRNVGIYPELKDPAWHRDQGLPLEEEFLAIIREYGYDQADAPIYVQCFEQEPLQRLRELGCEARQIFLMGDSAADREIATADGLKAVALFANGIGPAKSLIERTPSIVEWAHALGLKVHPFTFRADDVGRGYATVEDELRKFIKEYKVDGVFTDHTDRVVNLIQAK
ncbi:MAG: glycerophosphodiester phosphodiesterase [Candidatus Hydrogenedentota bacterium]